MQEGPIWIVNEDREDHDLIQEILNDLNFKTELVLFTKSEDLLASLAEAKEAPFIIISDANMPGMDGFELREHLLSASNKKFHSVPFIFWSVTSSEVQVQRAYELKAHGFFIKEATYEEWRDSLLTIIRYWQKSKMPSKKDQPSGRQL